MQPSTVEKESSGRSSRSGRSGRSREEVVKGRKKVVMELEKVAAVRDGWTAVKGTETAVEKESSGRSARSGRSGEEVVMGRKKVVVEKVKVKVAAEKKKAEKEKKDRMWKELLEQKKRERRERKVGKQMEKQLEEEKKECEKQSEQCREVWKMSVAAEEDGWTSVKGKRLRRSEESSVLSEEEFPSFEKEKKEKEMKEKVRKECFEKKRRERLAREEKKREKKMEKKLEEEKKELERQRVQKKQEKVQLKREKEERGSERRMAAGFKRARKQSSEERVVEKIMSDNLLLEPEQKRRRSGRSSEGGERVQGRKPEKVESAAENLERVEIEAEKCKSANKVRSMLSQKDKVTVQVPVVAAVPAVPVAKASSGGKFRKRKGTFTSEVKDLSFVWPGLGSKVRIELDGGSVADEMDESVTVCRSIVDEMIEGIGLDCPLLNVSVQCQVNEVFERDLDRWVSVLDLDDSSDEGSEVVGSPDPVLEEEASESEGAGPDPVLEKEASESEGAGPVLEEETENVRICRSMVVEIVEIAVSVSDFQISDFLNVGAQLCRSFEGVVHFEQPSDSEEEQGWDEYVGVGVGVDEVGVDEVGVGVGVDVGVDEVGLDEVGVGVGVDEVGVGVGVDVGADEVGLDEVGVGVGVDVGVDEVGLDEVGVGVGVGVDQVGVDEVGVGGGVGVDEVGVGVDPEQEEYWVEDSNGFRERVFPCHDCLIEYKTLDGLQEHICLPDMLPHFLLNDTPDVTTPKSPSLVPTKTRISCAVIGCDTTFARKDAMLRHVRNLHKIPKDHPCYPGNQNLNPVQFLNVEYEDEGSDPELATQDTADDDDVVSGDEGGDPEPAQVQDTADDDDVVSGDEGGAPEPAQVQDIAPVEPALEPRRPTFISDEFKQCLRTVFEELPGKVTSQQIQGKIQENRELQTYWEEYLQVNKSRSKAVDTVKKFLGGSRQVSKGYMDPAIENSLWALLTPDSVLTTKALVKRAAEDEQFKVVWDHFRSRRKTASDAAKWLRTTALRKQ